MTVSLAESTEIVSPETAEITTSERFVMFVMVVGFDVDWVGLFNDDWNLDGVGDGLVHGVGDLDRDFDLVGHSDWDFDGHFDRIRHVLFDGIGNVFLDGYGVRLGHVNRVRTIDGYFDRYFDRIGHVFFNVNGIRSGYGNVFRDGRGFNVFVANVFVTSEIMVTTETTTAEASVIAEACVIAETVLEATLRLVSLILGTRD